MLGIYPPHVDNSGEAHDCSRLGPVVRCHFLGGYRLGSFMCVKYAIYISPQPEFLTMAGAVVDDGATAWDIEVVKLGE